MLEQVLLRRREDGNANAKYKRAVSHERPLIVSKYHVLQTVNVHCDNSSLDNKEVLFAKFHNFCFKTKLQYFL